jgi:hypothetical protein
MSEVKRERAVPLQLMLADWSHIPHSPPVMSEPITITVK